MLLAIGISLLLTFSFIIVQSILKVVTRVDVEKSTIIFWGMTVIVVSVISLWYGEQYIYKIPERVMPVMTLFFIVAIVNVFLAQRSGYRPIGIYDTIHFCLTYPLLEEMVFRGLVLPLLSSSMPTSSSFTIMGLSVTPAVLITAFLFAICHLQYYRLSRMSIRFMLFAFFGGIFFGIIADHTHSIWLPLMLHIEFNVLSVYFSGRRMSAGS
ncbi:CPBP family intramembrane glutamic endopeptidase [Paenibacillus alvei]|uniref:CPBP family intramembrane glutamic endopeptidase n=1 Tax=Paenibacillus alvei TaxID=44250 RepID=UPI00038582D0|nr:CPBP family intramembrane glutamic endopeptidase [Paenibacillus alvei]EPY10594.1 CAAX amino terminal protease [Paenibacillus alvei A6-6i-x]